jgi:hypothetical protein
LALISVHDTGEIIASVVAELGARLGRVIGELMDVRGIENV